LIFLSDNPLLIFRVVLSPIIRPSILACISTKKFRLYDLDLKYLLAAEGQELLGEQ
jgi:hypothetical protein